MGFKKIVQNFTFADAILKDSMDKNRCRIRIMDIANSIDWNSIEAVLTGHYQVGTSKTPIHRCCCLRACCFKNGFISIRIRNSKARLMIEYHSKNSWDCR